MGLKQKIKNYLMSNPHLSLLWNMRKHPRYEPQEGLDIQIGTPNQKLYAFLGDICLGGMRIVSTDSRIDEAKRFSLTVGPFSLDLPCEKIRKIKDQYGIVFGEMNKREMFSLKAFIARYTKDLPSAGMTEMLR